MLDLSIDSPVSASINLKTSTRLIKTHLRYSLLLQSISAFFISKESFSAQIKSAPYLNSSKES
jgi:hypothetical protein